MEPALALAIALPDWGAGPRRQALHRALRAAIVDGRLPAGTPLPATRELAATLGVARNTVIAAYDLLVAEGFVELHDRSRAVVVGSARRQGRKPASTQARARVVAFWRDPNLIEPPRTGLPERCFRLGVPDDRLFPHALWRRLSMQALRAFARQPFRYPPTEGLPALREAIAQHVAFTRAVACAADDVVVTSGAVQAFDLIARLLVTPSVTKVAVEEPGYPPLRAPLLAAGAVLVPVPVDEDGLRVDRLPPDARIVCVTPSHQSPTGVALSLERRRSLLAFAQQHDAVIIEDDYDGEFRFGARPLDALQMLDREGRVFYVCTFSKSVFPALRKGFVVAPAWARAALVRVKQCTDAHGDEIGQATLAAFIRDGHLARHVRRMRRVYGERRRVLLRALEDELADWVTPIASEVGLHLAAKIRQTKHAARIVAVVREFTPGAQSTDEYAIAKLSQPAVVFGYGVIDAAAIRPAIRRVRKALERGTPKP